MKKAVWKEESGVWEVETEKGQKYTGLLESKWMVSQPPLRFPLVVNVQ